MKCLSYCLKQYDKWLYIILWFSNLLSANPYKTRYWLAQLEVRYLLAFFVRMKGNILRGFPLRISRVANVNVILKIVILFTWKILFIPKSLACQIISPVLVLGWSSLSCCQYTGDHQNNTDYHHSFLLDYPRTGWWDPIAKDITCNSHKTWRKKVDSNQDFFSFFKFLYQDFNK